MLPKDFIKKADFYLPTNEHTLFLESLTQNPCISIRKNPFKNISKFDEMPKVLWENKAHYLPERISFTTDPHFWAGNYYVQEASSMFVGEILRQIIDVKKDLKILDLCAAPGGKSTHILSEINPNSFLISNEIVRNRTQILNENLSRWGNGNSIVTSQNAESIGKWRNLFDIIVLDAPCSGEGMFRKEPNAISEWSLENVSLCVQRQQNIVENILPSLKEGGFLLYSTCTFNTEENEKNILPYLSKGYESVRIMIEPHWNIIETETQTHGNTLFAYRFYPHLVRGEGFFITCLRKTFKENSQQKPHLKNPNLISLPLKKQDFLKKWFHDIKQFHFFTTQKNEIFALPIAQAENMHLWGETFHAWRTGFHVCTRKHEDVEPTPEFAFALCQSKEIPTIDLEEEIALQFLRKNEIDVPIPSQKGWYLATFQGFGLGWLKALPNRWNNYYPNQWKIKHL
jgi:16S rRNA C967 or C1407 C5-methylase (RsmB/RsmF family)/NOL1/NOP2/fmu family ribosome biogenesis protein